MPDAALISALEELRDSYGQRQRMTANLLVALKGATGALGKAGKSLREYAERSPGAGDGVARAIETLAASRLRDDVVEPLLPGLRREAKLLTAQVGALKDAVAALRAEAVDVIRLGHAVAALQASKLPDPAVAALLPRLEEELEEGQRALGDTFGLVLRHVLAERGVELGGRPPRFEIGPFELVADFVSRSADLSYGKTLVVRRIPLSAEAVIKAYEREARAIMGRDEDAARWTEQLYMAWETVRRRKGSTEPRANIVECYFELAMLRQPKGFRFEPSKHLFKDYTRAQFAYDFFEFTGRRPRLHQGLRAFGLVATKSQTDNPERSMWIVEGNSPHDGRYIGDVKFDRDE